MSTTQQRPPHVTMAAGMVMGGSVFVILSIVEQLGSLRSIESREGIESFLSRPPGNGLGLDVEGVISILHVTSLVGAACAAATAILGWHVLKRDLKARLALTVLAVPLFVSGLVTGGFISSLVAASVVVLWLPPAREWFRTGSWTPPAAARRSVAAPTPDASRPTPASWQPPGPPSGDHAEPPPQRTPYGMPSQVLAPPRLADPREAAPPSVRPRALVRAFVLTVVFAAIAALMAGLSAIAMVVAPDAVLDELGRQRPDLAEQGVTPGLLRATTIIMAVAVVAWSVLAVVLGSLAMAGREWARLGLMASAFATVFACLVMAFAAPFLLLPALAAGLAALNLRRPEVREWCARRPARPGSHGVMGP